MGGMPKRAVPRPTNAELAVLRVLWAKGPSTVRQVHDTLSRDRPLAYTTALKLLQIMTEKGLTTREELGLLHVYRPRYLQEQTQRRLVGDLIEQAFGGSMSKLVMQALATKPASREELREIRRLLAGQKERRHD